MYFIIVGASKISYSLIKFFLEKDNEVLLIEKDKERATRFSEDFDIISITDDATKGGVLEQANVEECNALIALTESDEVNLIIGMMAKEKGAKKVAVKLSKTTYDNGMLKRMGIDLAIHPEAAAAAYVEEVLLRPAVLDLAFLTTGDAELEEILIAKDSPYIKKKLNSLNTEKERVIAIYEGKSLKFPKGDYVLKENDRILVFVNKSRE